MTERLHNILRISLLSTIILWGLYTFFLYVSVPVHQLVLLSDADRTMVTNACPSAAGLCVGWFSLFPVLKHVLVRAEPFLWYFVWSVVLFCVLLGSEFFRSGHWNIRFTLTPWKLWLCFAGFLWLLFTVLSNGGDPTQPNRVLFYPTTDVYTNASADTLKALADDYTALKERGCLIQIRSADQGGEVSSMRQSCMQMSFVTRVLSEVLLLSYLLLVLVSLGRFFLRLFRVSPQSLRMEALFSAGLGACALIVLLWSLAVMGIYTQKVGLAAMVIVPIAVYPHVQYWAKRIMTHRWDYEGPWYAGALILGWLLLSYLVFNFLTVVRPFPIGWDDLGVYMNDPRLLVSYGRAIPRMPAFQWEYMTSLGFLLFGYESYVGATTSMLINWMAGLLAVCSVYVMASSFFGKKSGFLAALLFYTLPLIGHFSFADMKVDNAVFTMGALSFFALFIAFFPVSDNAEHQEQRVSYQWIAIAGIFAGFAFAFKATTIMVTMALIALLAGITLHPIGFIGVALFGSVALIQKALNVADLSLRIFGDATAFSKTDLFLFFSVCGLIFTGVALYLKPKHVQRVLIAGGIFIGCFALSIAPWIVRNNILSGTSLLHLQMAVPNTIKPTFAYIKGDKTAGLNVRSLPEELRIDPEAAACKSGTSKSEELDRYWGYGKGWSHYLGLPWRTVMNADSAGYYVTTMPALLLFPLLLLLPYFWKKQGRWLRWLFCATVFMIVEWMFLANGVPWYGIGMFLGLAITLEALVTKAPDRATKITASIVLGLSLVLTFCNRFWQYEQQSNLYSYSYGVVSGKAMEERTIPHYGFIRDTVLQRIKEHPETPYLYRVGTFIPYFIPKNLEVIPIGDHQLDMFTCLYAERDAALTVKRMKALGFNSIVFDTNTQTIERDPNGTLHKKVQQFVDFLNTPNTGIQIIISDTSGGIAFALIH